MSYILNSTEILIHVPKKGINKNDLKREIQEMRNLSFKDAEKSIERALLKGTIIRKKNFLKPSHSIKFPP